MKNTKEDTVDATKQEAEKLFPIMSFQEYLLSPPHGISYADYKVRQECKREGYKAKEDTVQPTIKDYQKVDIIAAIVMAVRRRDYGIYENLDEFIIKHDKWMVGIYDKYLSQTKTEDSEQTKPVEGRQHIMKVLIKYFRHTQLNSTLQKVADELLSQPSAPVESEVQNLKEKLQSVVDEMNDVVPGTD